MTQKTTLSWGGGGGGRECGGFLMFTSKRAWKVNVVRDVVHVVLVG